MQRRHDLDWVRVCAFGVLVLYHVGMYYVTWDWHVKSPAASDTLEPFMLLSSPWRLALLFLVSGAATAFLLEKARDAATAGGVRTRFLGSRSWRLLLPLVFGMLVIVPPQSYYEVVEQLPGGYHAGYLAFYARYLAGYDGFCDADGCLDMPTWNHLWFVAYLWVYTVVLWLLWRVAPRALEAAARGLDKGLEGIGVLVWPTLFLGLVRILLVGRFEQTHALVDDWYNHAQYFSVFLLGFLIARSEAVWAAMARMRWAALLLWLGSWAGLIAYFVRFADGQPPELLRTAMRMVWGLDQWCAIVAVLGFARHWNPGDSRVLRYLVPAVFPVYILHQTVTVVVAHHLKPLAIPPLAEGLLLVFVTFAACFAGYEVVRRIAWLRPLFGLKRTVRGRTDGAPAMASSSEA
ncbi:Acyltransferase family protein [Pseudoxanthomonas sp. CF385]|uniref:acyltransferase family protein n=1 Tax=Pseudoxanthomonas sp. CF385 TaxID=1881042 RepID=UPI000885AC5B|nr:acyltransferase family protein [Pseudoxanthomonas sp. CF385]SDQ65150.1 Acyltransferase family protein [Pseudoxanthomonas sp. CF385]